MTAHFAFAVRKQTAMNASLLSPFFIIYLFIHSLILLKTRSLYVALRSGGVYL